MQRKMYIDYMRAIAIMLVVVGHINSSNAFIKSWIYEFHMPLFFVITGLTISKKKLNIGTLNVKIKALIIPYFLWGFIYMSYSSQNIARLLFGSYKTISSAGTLTSLWFLPTLFTSYWIAQLIIKINNKYEVLGFSILSLIIGLMLPCLEHGYPWSINVSLIGAFFIVFGYLVKTVLNKLYKINAILFVTFVGFAITLLYKCDSINIDSNVLMATGRLGNPIIFIVVSVGGTLFVYSLSRLLEVYLPDSKILAYIGQNTLSILVIHKPVIRVLENMMSMFSISDILKLLIIFILTFLVVLIETKVIDKFIPALIGKV